jgi:hypothetical protein
MSQPMPISDFKWENISTYDQILTADIEGSRGFVLEVDLEYPTSLHQYHNDFPLAPHHLNISYDMLSPYARQFVKPCYKSSKLCQTFLPRTHYVIHFRNLQQYIRLGLKVTNVHRILSFKQSTWLKPYIDYNTSMRAVATTDFEKDFFQIDE